MNTSAHSTAPRNGARWLTQALEAEGVHTLFGLQFQEHAFELPRRFVVDSTVASPMEVIEKVSAALPSGAGLKIPASSQRANTRASTSPGS